MIAVVLSQIELVKDVPYTGAREVDVVGAACPWWGWAAWCWGSWCGRRAAITSCADRDRRVRAWALARWSWARS